MDFQKIVDANELAAAVMSVEKKPDGHYGEIRIVRANSLYKKIMGNGYHDGMLYSELIPVEKNFEDFCYRSAVLKQHLHAYVETKALDVWTDGNYIPLSSKYDTDNLCYFLFLFEFTKRPDAKRLADISMEIAPLVIQTCINLRNADNFTESMNTVICDIREKTEAFCSSIIMIDKEHKKYAPLCTSLKNNARLEDEMMKHLTPEVVFSWEETIGKHDCIIVKNEHDMEELEKINSLWVKSLKAAKVNSLVLAPLQQKKKIFGVL